MLREVRGHILVGIAVCVACLLLAAWVDGAFAAQRPSARPGGAVPATSSVHRDTITGLRELCVPDMTGSGAHCGIDIKWMTASKPAVAPDTTRHVTVRAGHTTTVAFKSIAG